MKRTRPLGEIGEADRHQVGGKAASLAIMERSGFVIPKGLCVPAGTYFEFVSAAGLQDRIFMELNRKSLDEMRWEELWDCSLRIRNMFLKTPLPKPLAEALRVELGSYFGDRSVAVRSSAPGEDSANASFAGIHDSYVNVCGVEEIVEHVKLVWASLWSDRALLYRRELNLNVVESAMAVIVQEMVPGDRSGVAYSVSPTDSSHAVIEAVYGLNQGLVDGTVEPDRWIVQRGSDVIVRFTPANRAVALQPATSGVAMKRLSQKESGKPPLNDSEVVEVLGLTRRLEELFLSPQDVEWTFRGDRLVVLQSRPITTASSGSAEDDRKWYLSLHRSLENLQRLRQRIEQLLLPAMDAEANLLSAANLSALSEAMLAEEIGRRKEIFEKWLTVYWDDFIPMSHGIRLFAQIYNDVMRPEDPYEFTQLLQSSGMLSVERNRSLSELAERLNADLPLPDNLAEGNLTNDPEFNAMLENEFARFSDLSSAAYGESDAKDRFLKFLLEMAKGTHHKSTERSSRMQDLSNDFLSRFPREKQAFGKDLLDLARASYSLRDDDNIHLGRIEAQFNAALDEAKSRVSSASVRNIDTTEVQDLARLIGQIESPSPEQAPRPNETRFTTKPRQLVGQPAGPGIAFGSARVIKGGSDLFDFKNGEILVCDAIDPNMTFVVPLCAGIVERRGGMLIHGAIIAREYGLPCVTGIPEAASAIQTGDRVTVDGFLGIVIIG